MVAFGSHPSQNKNKSISYREIVSQLRKRKIILHSWNKIYAYMIEMIKEKNSEIIEY